MFIMKSVARAERFVAEQVRLGNDVEFEGWDISFYRPDVRAQYSAAGVWRNGGYAFKNTYVPGENGWEIDSRNIRRGSGRR